MSRARVPGIGRFAIRTPLVVAALLYAALVLAPAAASAQSGLNRTSPFLGLWCVQGDLNRRALITGGPFGLNLAVEHGPTSTGVIAGPFSHQLTAPQWNLLAGTLSPDEETINWSNNTYWTRCRARIDVQGTWYLNGDPSRPCRINQNSSALVLQNDAGQTGNGTFTARDRIVAIYSGIFFSGKISADDNRIDWDNGTYWSR